MRHTKKHAKQAQAAFKREWQRKELKEKARAGRSQAIAATAQSQKMQTTK